MNKINDKAKTKLKSKKTKDISLPLLMKLSDFNYEGVGTIEFN